jgi:hypothetical protein
MMDGLSFKIQSLYAVIFAKLLWEVVPKLVYSTLFKEITLVKLQLDVCSASQNFQQDGFQITECLLELVM